MRLVNLQDGAKLVAIQKIEIQDNNQEPAASSAMVTALPAAEDSGETIVEIEDEAPPTDDTNEE